MSKVDKDSIGDCIYFQDGAVSYKIWPPELNPNNQNINQTKICPCPALPEGMVVVDKRELENLRELERRVRHSQIGKYNLYICEALVALEEKPYMEDMRFPFVKEEKSHE